MSVKLLWLNYHSQLGKRLDLVVVLDQRETSVEVGDFVFRF